MPPSRLVCVEGAIEGQEFPLDGKLIFDVGTAATADVSFPDPDAGPVHCKLYLEDSAYSIFDVSSRGFTVNGRHTVKTRLENGDIIRIGKHSFKFVAPVTNDSDEEPFPVEPAVTAKKEERKHRVALRSIKGHDAGKVFDLSGKDMFILGRGIATDITVWDIRVSRVHCRLDNTDGTFVLSDLNASNGTYVNGKKVSNQQRLHHGDYIKIGSSVLQFQQESDPVSDDG